MEGGVISETTPSKDWFPFPSFQADALVTRLAATLAGVETKVAGHQNQIMFLSVNE